MILTPEKEEEMKRVFRAVYETKLEAKALNQANTEMFKVLASYLQVEKSDVTDAFKYWQKRVQKKKGDINTVDILVNTLAPSDSVDEED